MACEHCRSKKIKCDSARPRCKHCSQRSLHCVYVRERQKRRKLSESEIENRFHRLETLVSFRAGQTADLGLYQGCSTSVDREAAEDRSSSPSTGEPIDQGGLTIREASSHAEDDIRAGTVRYKSSPHSQPPQAPSMVDRILHDGERDRDEEVNEDPAIWLRLVDGDEYTGPSSGIVLLSAQGVRWIQTSIGPTQSVALSTFDDLKVSLLNHLRIPKCVEDDPWADAGSVQERKPLPYRTEIWQYVDAYFDSVQTIFVALDRRTFVERLSDHLSNPSDNDPSWYALLNAVLACGCRAARATESPEGFLDSGREAWAYFKNALAMEPHLMHRSTNLIAVQAFTVMTIYAQGMSSPQRLEFTLSSIASRLAQTIGLHRRTPSDWNLPRHEQVARSRLFWIVYCLDKTIALRCGRPCVLDDDEISCDFAHLDGLPSGATADSEATDGQANIAQFDFLLCYTRFARLCGVVGKRLYSAKALGTNREQLSSTAAAILEDVELWRRRLPEALRPNAPFNPRRSQSATTEEQQLSLHFGYFYIICAIHRRFTPLFQRGERCSGLASPVDAFSYIEAARRMILLTKHLDIGSYTPAWLLFYYPMTAMLTVFAHIICHPNEATAKNDVALMEVVVGFFGRLEFVTSGVAAFTKTGEIVRLARRAIEQASEGHSTIETTETSRSGQPVTAAPKERLTTEFSDFGTRDTGEMAPVDHFEDIFTFSPGVSSWQQSWTMPGGGMSGWPTPTGWT